MAVTLTGSNGLFTRLGKIFFVWQKIETLQSDLATEIEDVQDEYTNTTMEYLKGLGDAVESLQLSSASLTFSKLRAAAECTVIEMVHADNPLPSKDLKSALTELIAQMENSSDDVDGDSPAIAIDSSPSTGNGQSVRSLSINEGSGATGDLAQHVRAESIVLTCTKDAQVTGTSGREIFSIKGEAPVSPSYHADWPDGSGINSSLRVTDPSEDAQSAAGRNILTNSDFETFTVTDQADNWTYNTGAAGTDFLEEGTITYRGSKSLELVGDGATLNHMSQAFDTSGATLGKLKPKTKYMMAVRISADTGVLAGVMRISVKDGSNNIVNSSQMDITLSGVSTGGTFDINTKEFNTPLKIPAGTKIVVELTTAITSTKSVYIDDLCLFEMTGHGPNGFAPYINVIAGSTPFVIEDEFVFTVTNGLAGEFAKQFDRFFDMYGLSPLQLPFDTGGAETISDALIA